MQNYIKVTHANLLTELYVRTDDILLAYYSKANSCTHLVMRSLSTRNEQAVWPVTEQPDQVISLIKTASNNNKE